MSFNVYSTPPFERQLKRLAKKYPSLKVEFATLLDQLESQPDLGTPIGNNCYKIRISIASKGKGKRGGGRIVTHIMISESVVFLVAIYDKSEKASLTDAELKELLGSISKEPTR